MHACTHKHTRASTHAQMCQYKRSPHTCAHVTVERCPIPVVHRLHQAVCQCRHLLWLQLCCGVAGVARAALLPQ
eukprot:1151827-Pelagomonas_calceolata.AAC.3